MSKRRIRFSKLGMAKYISHLDLLRCFTRAIMRSGLPVEYSQGFNPHMKITFALPLPVGVTSECEAADISFEDEKVTDSEIAERLNLNLPPDIRVISVGDIISAASSIVCAEYVITLRSDGKITDAQIKEFFAADEIVVMKKTKKKIEKPINIIDYVRVWETLAEDKNSLTLRLVLDAGGERNLKPDAVVGALCEKYPPARADDADIHRNQIFCKSNGDDETIEIFE